MSHSKGIESPGGFDLLRISGKMFRNPLYGYEQLQSQFGDICYMPIFKAYFVFDPKLVKEILLEHGAKLSKGKRYINLHLFLGEGLVTSQGKKWGQQRKVMARHFNQAALSQYAQIIDKRSKAFLPHWQESAGKSINVLESMSDLTFQIALEVIFGLEDLQHSKEIMKAFEDAAWLGVRRIFRFFNLPRWVPTRSHIREKEAVRFLEDLVDSIIDRVDAETESASKAGSFVQRLLSESTSDPAQRKQLRDEVLTLLFAGHDTTSHGLAWTLFCLSENQEVQLKLQEELRPLSGNGEINIDSVLDAPYLRAVILESLRRYPPVPGISRMPLDRIQLSNGWTIPHGETLVIPIYALHNDKRNFPEPDVFNPDRFSAGEPSPEQGLYFLPFAAGPRNCIGERFAMMELKIVLAHLLSNFQVLPAPSSPRPEPHAGITLGSQTGIHVTPRRLD